MSELNNQSGIDLSHVKRVVFKVGTSTLTHATGRLNLRRVERLVRTLADIRNSGREIILVSSGAIGVGVGKLGLKRRPTDVPSKQAAAAVGQCELMYMYDKQFSEYSHTVAQVLITGDDISDAQRKQNVCNTFERLLDFGAIPIVNENDTVAVEEIMIGDNDTLSAIVASLTHADLLVILSDIDGLYDKDPHKYQDARLIRTVSGVTDEILALAGGKGSELGTGGMFTKLHAAQVAQENGIDMIIMNGRDPARIYDIFDPQAPFTGTLFKAREADEDAV